METRNLVHIALFAALIAALGLLPKVALPIAGGVPITAQTLGVMLAGLMLGSKRGALAVILFLGIVALGAPFLAGGRGGLGVFYSPSAGFLLGWIPGAFVTGLLFKRFKNLPVLASGVIASLLGGVVVIYALGIPWLASAAKLSLTQAFVGSLVFLPGDLLKAVAAAFALEAARRARPQALLPR